tara:strand:+ start:40 stop:588 length:549 start_codon:yes stop_codon:yes gene_type:complete
MPNVGDTKDKFGRSYIYLNPATESGDTVGTVGTWRLRVDDTGTPSGGGGGGGGTTDLSATAIAAVNISAGQLVRIDSTGKLDLADASSIATGTVAGMAMETKSAAAPCKYVSNMIQDFFFAGSFVDGSPTNLTPGITYYLSTTPGNWTTTPDTTTAGAVVRSCGVAVDTDKMSIEIQSATVI